MRFVGWSFVGLMVALVLLAFFVAVARLRQIRESLYQIERDLDRIILRLGSRP